MLVHICNNYVSSKVHAQLVSSISRSPGSIEQKVYVPVRNKNHVGMNDVSGSDVSVKYVQCLNGWIRFFPLLKVLWVFLVAVVNKVIAERKEGFVLAHTLWSDGVVAYLYRVFWGVEYALVVRNTDLNWFLPRLPHYRWLVRKVIRNSNALVFIGPAYRDRFARKYPGLYSAASEIRVIPNGVDKFWIDNVSNVEAKRNPLVSFVGRFDKNKNIGNLCAAVELARKKNSDIELHMVGGEDEELKVILGTLDLPHWIRVHGVEKDKEKVRQVYASSAVFLMPSFHETFGLVYIEALSQGCPFIFSKGEAVDGFFLNPRFARAVDPHSVIEISEMLLELIDSFPCGVPIDEVNELVGKFDWNDVSNKYIEVCGEMD